MSLTPPRLLLAAALTLLAATTAVRADAQPWSYSWYRDDFVVSANGGGRFGGVALILPPTANPDALWLRAFTALRNGADSYIDAAYTATFTLTDNATGQTHSLAVNGEFDGTVTPDGVNLSNTFTGGTGSQTFNFLGRAVAVNFGFTSPGGPPLGWQGLITASVSDAAAGPDVLAAPDTLSPAQAPEPVSLVLAALALPALGLAALRRRVRRGTEKSIARPVE